MKVRLLRRAGPLFGLFLFTAALWVLQHELREYHYKDIIDDLKRIPSIYLVLASALTILDYLALTGYDALAFRYIDHYLRYSKIAVTSFISYAFSHSMGFALLSGAPVRYRLYSSFGFSAVEITRVVAFTGLTLWLGFFTVGALVFLLEPMVLPRVLHLPFASARPLGVIFLFADAGYFLGIILRKRPLKIRGWEVSLPSLKLSLAQILVSSLDWMLAGGVLYALLPSTPALSYWGFLGIFLLAQCGGILSQIPGGLGVFETVFLLLLSHILPASSVLGSLLVYRGIYYLLPLGVAAALIGIHEVLVEKGRAQRAVLIFGGWAPVLVPYGLALATFCAGVILLFSGAIPSADSRLFWLRDILPLPVLEISHFLGSLAGIGLLLLARGLQQRLDGAYFLTGVLLSAGILFSLLKGFDYPEAIILSIMLGALLPCRRHFYRKASLITERFTLPWIVAIALVLLTSISLGVFSYKHVPYSHELWWRFSFSDDAPRFLRATVGAVGVVLFLAFAKLLRPALAEPTLPSPDDLEKARAIVEGSLNTSAYLALLGDKTLLFNDVRTAFIMYGIKGRSWVALGDPVGPESEMSELIWQFHELCDRHGGWTVFYEIPETHVPLYVAIGLTVLKIGEAAHVPLRTFSLEGSPRKGLRHTHQRIEREGCTFEVVPPERLPPLLLELKRISDVWLEEKKGAEKRFSLGCFKPEYLKQFPTAIIKREGKILSFANILPGAENEELSADLIRYLPQAPHGVMEYLLIELMLWGKQEGYRRFSLGMSPLSGMENRPFAPLWNRIGAFVFHHGEHFYHFQGLREFKEKFDPQWEPRYLASPAGLFLPRILADIASLIGGGLQRIVTK